MSWWHNPDLWRDRSTPDTISRPVEQIALTRIYYQAKYNHNIASGSTAIAWLPEAMSVLTEDILRGLLQYEVTLDDVIFMAYDGARVQV